ncbi:MAG: class I SAM-dependent methyltransferase [Aggregatilineales bacterium]
MIRQFLKRLNASSRPPVQTLSSLDAYALWAQNYPPHVHNPLMQAEETAMLALMPALKDKVVLDLACGSGRFSRLAQERGAKQVIAFDNSLEMLKTGVQNLGQQSPQFGQATLTNIPLKRASVDVVLCGLAVGHIPALEPAIAEISRVLKTGGVVLMSDFHPYLFLSGKQRTFTAPDGQTFAVEHYAHLHSAYWSAARGAGLRLDAIQEPRLRIEGRDVPVVMVYRFVKTPVDSTV